MKNRLAQHWLSLFRFVVLTFASREFLEHMGKSTWPLIALAWVLNLTSEILSTKEPADK